MKRSLLINLSLLLGTVLFLFLCAELWFRFFNPQSENQFWFDPLIGSRVQPGKFVTITDGEVHYKRANSQGFVDREWTLEKPSGVKRIVILGDSFTEAIQVDDDKNYKHILEDKLRKNAENVEVLNFAVRGQSTVQEYLTLKNYARAYKPDVIIVETFLFNDVSSNTPFLGATKSRPFIIFRDGKEVLIPPQNPEYGFPFNILGDHFHSYRWTVTEFFLAKSAVQKIISSNIENTTPPDRSRPTFFDIYDPEAQNKPEWKEAWDITEEMFRRIQDIAKEEQAELLVMEAQPRYEIYQGDWKSEIQKYPGADATRYDLSLPRKKAKEIFQKLGILYIDLVPIFQEFAGRGEKLYMPTDGHANVRGHEVMAQALFDALQKE